VTAIQHSNATHSGFSTAQPVSVTKSDSSKWPWQREEIFYDQHSGSPWPSADAAALADDHQENMRIAREDREAIAQVRRLHDLPSLWQQQIVNASPSSVQNMTADIIESVSPYPSMSRRAQSYLSAVNIVDDCRAKRRTPPLWAVQVADDSRAESEFYDALAAQDAWRDARNLRPKAFKIAEKLEVLKPIPAPSLMLIDKDDNRLREIAEMKAATQRGLAFVRNSSPEAEPVNDMTTKILNRIHPREFAPETHLRRLRALASRTAIWASANLGFIGGKRSEKRPNYADDWTLHRYISQIEANEKWAAEHDIVDEFGISVPLDFIIKSSENSRRAQWYAMILGLTDRAKRDGMIAVFVTCTLPSKYHANPSEGVNSHDPRLSPTIGAQELNRRWGRVRARLRKAGIRYPGVRTIEPHADGTGHYHFQLWIFPDDYQAFYEAFDDHFNDGKRVKTPALKIKKWKEKGAGSASSYVMSYVMKALHPNLNGNAENRQLTRARAWMKHAGVRRIALVGLAEGVMGRWQVAYRLLRQTATPTCCRTRKLVQAMRRKQWALALLLAGAFHGKAAYKKVTEAVENRWGDIVKKTIAWAVFETGEIAFVCRPKVWKIIPRTTETASNEAVSVVVSLPRGGQGPPDLRCEIWHH
jgi:Bacteriophage replication gene A protein (GPA)